MPLLLKMPNSKYQYIIFTLILFLFSFLSVLFMGGGVGIESFESLFLTFPLFISLYLLISFSKKTFSLFVFFISLLSISYLPQAITYGHLNFAIVASLFETNLAESLEYVSGFSLKIYILALLYLVSIFFVLGLGLRLEVNRQILSKKIISLLVFFVIFSIFNRPLLTISEEKKLDINSFNSTDYYPFNIVFNFISLTDNYLANKKRLNDALARESTWHIRTSQQKYKTYVIVIGESMRSDYMSLYDYQIKTTPFLDTVNATIFNNYIAPGPNTATSLQRMFIQHNELEKFIYSNTLITLSNKAGLETYWLSNQGKMGNHDTFVSSIAIKANYQFFTKTGDYLSNNTSDLELLPEFSKIIKKEGVKTKLIVLHLMGSHSNFCKRLDKNYHIDLVENIINQEMSCYLSSIKQTDNLLQRVYLALQKSHTTFSMMYFSDHGLSHIDKENNRVTLRHGFSHKENYDVPLVLISSDDNKRKYIDTKKSGYDFMNHASEWLGIETVELSKKHSFYSNEENTQKIQVYSTHHNNIFDYDTFENDPAIQDFHRR